MSTREHFHPSDDVLIAFALDELGEALHEAVDSHVDECDHCQRQCAATNETLALLALAAPPVAPPPHLRARVLDVPRQSPRVSARAPRSRCGAPGCDRAGSCRRCWWRPRPPLRSRCRRSRARVRGSCSCPTPPAPSR